MNNTKTVRGTYGSHYTPCNVFIIEDGLGYWYAIEGSRNVNYTYQNIEPGVDVELLTDVDYFYASEPIESIDKLIDATEDR